jgi:hypothetical protein
MDGEMAYPTQPDDELRVLPFMVQNAFSTDLILDVVKIGGNLAEARSAS